jgi:hypothetical protein
VAGAGHAEGLIVIERGRLSLLSKGVLTACGIWPVALGLYFIVLRPPLLPEDPRFIGATLTPLRQTAPGLEPWLRIAMNFVLHSDFRWVLAVPAALWIVGVAAYAASD